MHYWCIIGTTDSLCSAGQTVTLSAALIIAGNLVVSSGATLNVPASATLDVGGALFLDGLVIGGGRISSTTIQVGLSSNFTLVVIVEPALGAVSVSVVVLSASSSLAGSFGTLGSIVYTGPNASCYAFGTPTQSSTATALTVTVSVSSIGSCTTAGSQLALPIGAIVGIAVGGAMAIVLILVFVLVCRNCSKRRKVEAQMAALKSVNHAL
jgi:hypothetical protein